MKKQILVVLYVALSQMAAAQADSCAAGVYMTGSDLVNNHLSHEVNVCEKGNKLTFPPIADWKLEVKITDNGNTYKFPQGSIYGYCDRGKTYRYSPGGRLYAIEDFYRIEQRGPLIIYTSLFNGGDEHFYSLNLMSPIKRLNVKNLKNDFAGQPGFVQAAKKLRKRSVKDGLAMEDKKGRFMINDIYEQTVRH